MRGVGGEGDVGRERVSRAEGGRELTAGACLLSWVIVPRTVLVGVRAPTWMGRTTIVGIRLLREGILVWMLVEWWCDCAGTGDMGISRPQCARC